MQCSLRIRVRTEMLGNQRVTKPMLMRVFRRVPPSKDSRQQSELLIDLPHWLWALNASMEDLKIPPVAFSGLHLPIGFRAPALHLFVRTWRAKGGERRSEKFEGIRAGAQLTIPFSLSSPYPPESGKIQPTCEELQRAFQYVGDFYGLSPFGSNLGLGRFDVIFCGLSDMLPQVTQDQTQDQDDDDNGSD